MPSARGMSLTHTGALPASNLRKKLTHRRRELTGNSATSRHLGAHRSSVKKETRGAVGVGAKGRHVRVLQAPQHLGAGMMVNISRAHRDHSEARSHSSK